LPFIVYGNYTEVFKSNSPCCGGNCLNDGRLLYWNNQPVSFAAANWSNTPDGTCFSLKMVASTAKYSTEIAKKQYHKGFFC